MSKQLSKQLSKQQQLSYNLEYSLIGAFLKGGLTANARDVITWLEPEMFSVYSFSSIYSSIRKQARTNDLIDILLLEKDFGENFATLAEIAKNTTAYSNLSGYAEKVRSSWVNRTAQSQMLELAQKLSTARDDQVEAITSMALAQLQVLLTSKTETKSQAVGELVGGYLSVLDARTKDNFNERLLFTGIQAVDDFLGGVNKTDITIIAGRPGTGKTEFALTVARNIINTGGSVLFFSLEMDNYQLIDRLLSVSSGISVKKMRNPKNLDEIGFDKINNSLLNIKDKQLYLVDKGGLTVEEIKAITENHLSINGSLSAIVIDYLGLVGHCNDRLSIREKFNDILFALKTFSKKIKVPIILLSQLNRNSDGSRPVLSDLRESGKIEEDASQVLMLYREKNHKPNSNNNYAEILIRKNRFGRLGTAYMLFKNGHFEECDQAMASEIVFSIGENSKKQPKFQSRYGKVEA
ncbi:DnaB-like helicase C-terminal domain-containing protein [Phocoenobacter skyensis]|uniref:DNA 5'-3' helicase n=1 Tax=Phocoenobacter skyensis TaxID=97481 RepID=A0ABT9JKG8_9PAST|nr:DnaB-like helicase C-terminal domain-containing protein [Pasteurella skyensis]MDP8078355.1 DnaB-like helicase C-terminal domain-containing protein [Pasteurella skyensis]MDP8084553.1 DnaB-like helicase C-terminal domain-containing protein [Pasteurella skyensis]